MILLRWIFTKEVKEIQSIAMDLKHSVINRVPTNSGNRGKPGKSRKSSMHGKIIEFEKSLLIMERSWNFDTQSKYLYKKFYTDSKIEFLDTLKQ